MLKVLDKDLFEIYRELAEDPAVRAVSHWTLPNTEQPFDEEVALDALNKDIDELFNLTSAVIDKIDLRSK